MSANIRRVLSSIGGWLMSGEVLYCGVASSSSSEYTLLIPTETYNKYSSGYLFLSLIQGYTSFKIDNKWTDNSYSTYALWTNPNDNTQMIIYSEDNGGIVLTPYSKSSYSINPECLFLAIPRTDI